MAEEGIYQWNKEETAQNQRSCEKGRRLLSVIIVGNLGISLLAGILQMQFIGFLLQLVLAFFLFRGSQIAKGFYILLAVLNVLSGFLCLVWRNDIMNRLDGAFGEMESVYHGIQLAPQAVPAVCTAAVILGIFSIVWGIFMMAVLTKNKNLIHYLEYQRQR